MNILLDNTVLDFYVHKQTDISAFVNILINQSWKIY